MNPYDGPGRSTGGETGGHDPAEAPPGGMTTLAETIPGFDLAGWQGVVVARDTPAAIVQRLNEELAAVLRAPDVHQRLIESGLAVVAGSPEAFAELIRRDATRFGKALTDAGIRPE